MNQPDVNQPDTNLPEPENLGVDGGIGNFIDDIADQCRASNGCVVEIGVAQGTGSTVAIQRGLKGHPDPLHISVDVRDYMEWRPRVDYWHLIIGDSREMETLLRVQELVLPRKIGVIYIDTNHYYDQMKPEMEVWGRVASEETVFLFHDTWMFGEENVSMNRAIKEWVAAHPGWVYEDWRTEAHGLGRVRYTGEVAGARCWG